MKLEKPGLGSRVGAYAIDWFVGDLFASIPVVVTYSMINNTTDLVRELNLLPYAYGLLMGIVTLFLSFVYFVIVPWKWTRGQTLGKRVFDLKIVARDGSEVGFRALLMRQMVGIILVEGCLYAASDYLRQLFGIVTGLEGIVKYIYYVQAGITILTCGFAIFGPAGRAFHDYLAGTAVINKKNNTGCGGK